MLITFTVSASGERKILSQDTVRSVHQGLFQAVAISCPAGVSSVEIWDSNGGRSRARNLSPSKDAPTISQVVEDFRKGLEATAKKVAKAIVSDEKTVADSKK